MHTQPPHSHPPILATSLPLSVSMRDDAKHFILVKAFNTRFIFKNGDVIATAPSPAIHQLPAVRNPLLLQSQ